MSKDTYYPQAYQCTSCKRISKHYIWRSKGLDAVHKCSCGEELNYTHEYEEPEVQAPGIKTMTKNRIVMDRKKRSKEHFKKEIFPTFKEGSLEKKHFSKKYGIK